MSHTLGQKTKTYLILQQLQRNIRQLKAIVSLGQLLWENNDQILHFAYCWLKVPVLLQWRGTNETAGYSLHHWFSNLISLSSLYTCSRHVVRRDNKWELERSAWKYTEDLTYGMHMFSTTCIWFWQQIFLLNWTLASKRSLEGIRQCVWIKMSLHGILDHAVDRSLFFTSGFLCCLLLYHRLPLSNKSSSALPVFIWEQSGPWMSHFLGCWRGSNPASTAHALGSM